MNDSTPDQSFGPTVRAALAEQGMSVRKLARRVHYDHAYVSRVLAGKQRPSAGLASRIDNTLDAGGALSTIAATLTPDDTDRLAHSSTHPSRVDAETVSALADVLAAQRRLEDVIGSRAVLPGTRAQLATVTRLAKEARGPHRENMVSVAAQWTQFTGWLSVALRRDRDALTLFDQAEELADEGGDATMAATATSFRGYIAWQQGRYPAMLRAAQGSLHTPGAHVAQHAFDTLQSAQALGALGERDTARRRLDEAAVLTEEAERQRDTTRPWHYYYTRPFFLLQVGIAYLNLGDCAEATDYLSDALNRLPEDQHEADWTGEYRDALAVAAEGR